MHVQEQAFRAYYASMTDGDLLRTAANRGSFITVAQQILAEEIARRELVLPAGSEPLKAEHAAGKLAPRFINWAASCTTGKLPDRKPRKE